MWGVWVIYRYCGWDAKTKNDLKIKGGGLISLDFPRIFGFF